MRTVLHSLSSSPSPPVDKSMYTINSIIASPTKLAHGNLKAHPPGTTSNIISPVSNILSSNGKSPVGSDAEQKVRRRLHKRRSVSAATGSATTYLSITGKGSRAVRTHSSSAISIRSTNLTTIKRSHSPTSVTLIGQNKGSNQRKKQKFSHNWALFGKSEQRLVSVDVSALLSN